jgi:hypothetical protein
MTETKQDIQAQIDRLDLDWLRGLESYKYQYPFGKQLPMKGAAQKKMLLPLWAIIGLGCLAPASDLLSTHATFVLILGVLLVLVFTLSFKALSKQEAAYKRYQQALGEYESERSKLQEGLDALD